MSQAVSTKTTPVKFSKLFIIGLFVAVFGLLGVAYSVISSQFVSSDAMIAEGQTEQMCYERYGLGDGLNRCLETARLIGQTTGSTSAPLRELTLTYGAGLVVIGGVLMFLGRPRNALADAMPKVVTTTLPNKSINLEEELKRLDDLKRRAVIDDAEYKRLRDNLISRS